MLTKQWLFLANLLLAYPCVSQAQQIRSHTSRMRLHPIACESGLRVEKNHFQLTFQKQDVLDCAAAVAKQHREVMLDTAFANHILVLRNRYAADTVRLTIIPYFLDLGKVMGNSSLEYKAELFYIVDRVVIRKKKFCVFNTILRQSLPYVKIMHIRAPDDSFDVMLTSGDESIYDLR